MRYIFTCILPAGSRILSVRKASDKVLAVRSFMARNGKSAGNNMDREPGTWDGKPGTGDGEPEPGTRDQGAPGTADGSARTVLEA